MLEEVEQAYQQVPVQHDVLTPLDLLDALDDVVQQAVETAHRAGEPLNAELQALLQRGMALRRAVEAVQRIFTFDTVAQRLGATQDARQKLGNDPVLERLEQQFVAEQQRVIAELRRNADAAHARSSIETELRLISSLREMLLDDSETAERYGQLEARQQLDEQLRLAEQAAGGAFEPLRR